MIAAIREFLKTCPLISKKGIINVNYLEGAKVKYTLDNVPCIPEVKRYSDGGSLRQFIFIFASREDYDANIVNKTTAEISRSFRGTIPQRALRYSRARILSAVTPRLHAFRCS